MRVSLGRSVFVMGLMAQMAFAGSPHRLVVVVGLPNDPRVGQQLAALQNDQAALRERDVLVQDLTPDAARRERPELGVKPEAAFEVLLVGKDGGVKLSSLTPVPAADLTALIDTMPMRQSEMRRRAGGL
jgi:hypothetical protein